MSNRVKKSKFHELTISVPMQEVTNQAEANKAVKAGIERILAQFDLWRANKNSTYKIIASNGPSFTQLRHQHTGALQMVTIGLGILYEE